MKLFVLLTPGIFAHSWLACTDYAEKNAAEYDHSKCRGWPRKADVYAPKAGVFGEDKGFDHRPQSGTSPCKTGRTFRDYQADHFSAVYFPGQQVILAHPMKNHGTGTSCTNKYIPDFGNWLYVQPQTPVNEPDPVLSVFKENELVDLGISPFGHGVSDEIITTYPKKGFQNAPNFCENTGLALATYSFNVPVDMESGEYTFVWLWAFNGPQDYYSTCFEVTVAKNAADRELFLATRGQTDFSLICDSGPTSTDENGSLVGCDGETTTKNTETTTKSTTTTKNTTTLPTTGIETGSKGLVVTNQMTGNIILPEFDTTPVSREVHVQFFADCVEAAKPNFWYARFERSHNAQNLRRDADHGTGKEIHFVLIQDNENDINRKMIGFHWALDGGCKLLQNPTQVNVIDHF